MTPLPVDDHVGRVRRALDERRAAVVVAPPGSGKTTRIPAALIDAGPVALLQPRRVAARSLARRIAAERGWTLGEQVGWQIRGERRAGPRTALVAMTEGVLTARLCGDPLLEGTTTVVLDEFHERSRHADLALAFVREACRARADLRVLVMSATLDPGPVAAYLDGCPVIEVDASPHPVTLVYRPELSPVDAVVAALTDEPGHVLCFLPGAHEIETAARELRRRLGSRRDVRVLPLYGALRSDAQDAALAPFDGRKVVLATNIAETSLTVDGVRVVIDAGRQRIVRRDPRTGLDRLETERVTRDAADQRAGRAGRTAPGVAWRLWNERDALAARREPELCRIDLARPLLEIAAWGGDPAGFPWFEQPPAAAVEDGRRALTGLGALDAGTPQRITELGRALVRMPLDPRLGRVVFDTGGEPVAAAACAVLAEGWRPRDGDARATACDLLPLVDRLREAPAAVRHGARELRRLGATLGGPPADGEDRTARLCRALLAAFPDRVACRREPGSRRLLLADGHGARLSPRSGVVDGLWLVALDVDAARRPGDARGEAAGEALVRLAARIDAAWLDATELRVDHELIASSGRVRASERQMYGELELARVERSPDPAVAASLLVAALAEQPLDEAAAHWMRRARFAGVEVDLDAAREAACAGRTSLPRFAPADWLAAAERARLERDAPDSLGVPSGRRVRLDYRDDGTVYAAVKLQELFGLESSPRLGPRREPVVFELLAPSGRPVQTTRDLAGFWRDGYHAVRRELRGRYPKHPWPEDPLGAEATARTNPRRRRRRRP